MFSHILESLFAEVDFSWLAMGLHPACCVDSIPKQTIAWHLLTDYSSNGRPCVDANTDLEREREITS